MSKTIQDPEQIWFNEANALAHRFVQDDEELGVLMLDHCTRYWEQCWSDGLSPQQALDEFIKHLQTGDLLARHKAAKKADEEYAWWSRELSMLRPLLIALSEANDRKQQHYRKFKLDAAIKAVVLRYRKRIAK